MTTRDHGRILCKIWQDKDFRALPRSAQAMYMQLLSQPGVNNAGILPLQVDKWVRGCDELTVESAIADLGTLSAAGFIVVDGDSFEVLIRSFIRNDGGMAHKYIFKNALRCAEAAESQRIRTALAIELLRLRRADATRTAEILHPSDTDPKPEVTPSESHSDRIETTSESEMAFGPDSNHSGVGEGEGVGESLVINHLGGSRVRTHAYADAREEPPPPHCPDHPGGTTAPCGPCKDARTERERYDAAERERVAAEGAEHAEAQRRRRLRAAEDRAAEIRSCAMCDADGYVNGRVCPHDPERIPRPGRAAAALEEARKLAAEQGVDPTIEKHTDA